MHSGNKSQFPFRAKVRSWMKVFKAVYISLCPRPDCISCSSPTLLASVAMLNSCCSLTGSALSGLRALALTVPLLGFPGGTSGKKNKKTKKPTGQWRRLRRHGFNPWVGLGRSFGRGFRIPWHTQVFPYSFAQTPTQPTASVLSPWHALQQHCFDYPIDKSIYPRQSPLLSSPLLQSHIVYNLLNHFVDY